jgi:pyruvate dehydrogenase E1 component beta subunit
MKKLTYMQAPTEALLEEFRRNDKAIHMATDIQPELLAEFGEERIRQTPISESGFVGAAIGLAGSGYTAVIDIRMATFGFVAMDQMVNQAAKITYMFGGQAKFPILIRMSIGAGVSFAAQHSISPYSMYMNVPGLKIILPSTPYDLKGLIKSAVRDPNPVICFEHSVLASLEGEVPDEDYTLPIGVAEIKRKGTDVTVVALSAMVHQSLAVAEEMEKEGVSVEVLDPRTLVPMDRDAIKQSVARTGRLVVVDEACRTCGAAAEILSLVTEDAEIFKGLKAAPQRVCGLDIPIPYSPPMERYAIPDRDKIRRAVEMVLGK